MVIYCDILLYIVMPEFWSRKNTETSVLEICSKFKMILHSCNQAWLGNSRTEWTSVGKSSNVSCQRIIASVAMDGDFPIA